MYFDILWDFGEQLIKKYNLFSLLHKFPDSKMKAHGPVSGQQQGFPTQVPEDSAFCVLIISPRKHLTE